MNEWIMNRWIGLNDRLYLIARERIIFAMMWLWPSYTSYTHSTASWLSAHTSSITTISFFLFLASQTDHRVQQNKPIGFACSFTYAQTRSSLLHQEPTTATTTTTSSTTTTTISFSAREDNNNNSSKWHADEKKEWSAIGLDCIVSQAC